ncbi:hypothetical protein LTR08_007686 [Meristemomyces frigidus]|nr:hypothetical protein LTR08_007686 [Meristemomyces frigidus]
MMRPEAQRQEQTAAFRERTGLRDFSVPSSSSGSAHTLRRTPKFDEPRPPRLRSSSVGSPPRDQSPDPRAKRDPERSRPTSPSPPRTSHRRATSAFYPSQPPHPALRVSKRTRAAILYAVEEALRNPNSFTPDLQEENAQMSDLAGGRANNGGARTGGPVPVPSGTPTGIRTPRDVMRDRNAREAKRQEEQRADEARRLADDRRRSAERRAAAVTGGAPRLSQAMPHHSQDVPASQGGFDGAADRRSGGSRVSGADVLGEPVSRTMEYPPGRTRGPSLQQEQEYPTSKPRGPSLSQQEQPRPAQPSFGGARRSQQSQGAPRQAGPQSAPSSQAREPSGETGARAPSSFPHAFERWETLSSHWEGLTSYWLHKLESNTEEIKTTIPNASTFSRQITDLSAAGANLFHAVVELQRLRASSERKFQRWFFETRADTERTSEMQGQMDRQLRLERNAREEADMKRAEAEDATTAARREVVEMRRELAISKEEARRAWEELGRKSEEEVKIANNLRAGQIATMAGVQVVPYFGGPSRSGTGGSQRPHTRDGQSLYGGVAVPSSAGAGGVATSEDERRYREEPSPTNTDPFTEQEWSFKIPPEQRRQKGEVVNGVYRPYPRDPAPTASGVSQQSVAPRADQHAQASSVGVVPEAPGSNLDAEQFYQHAPSEASSHAVNRPPPTQREDVRSEPSYVDTVSEGDTEYALDPAGNIRHDDQGRAIVYRRRGHSEASDEYDEEAIRHERELAARYGSQAGYGGPQQQQAQQAMPEAPSAPATSAQAMETYTPTTGAGGPDYEGQGYQGWDTLATRHHHPTRLSDVLEEEEERSSRRMGE